MADAKARKRSRSKPVAIPAVKPTYDVPKWLVIFNLIIIFIDFKLKWY